EISQRFQASNRQRRHVRQARRAAGADRPPGRGVPRVRLLGQGGPALRALAELRPEAGAIKEMEVEPAAHRGGVDARVERAKGRLEQVEERRRWDAIGRETIDELGDVPARGDEGEIVAHVGVDGASFGSGQDVELTSAGELVGGVRQRLRVTGDAGRVLPAAAAIELLHNFTLIHDDIEDQDPARHHRPTVWSVWGEPQAINAGDGMFAVSRLAVQRLRGFPAERVLEFAKLVDEACVRVCEGQFLDISFETRTDVTTERYRGMAAKKTGGLFAAAAQGAALLPTEPAAVRETLARFGAAFGQAFQAHDDV